MNGQRKVVMAKSESPYGTDAVPAGATDAFQAINFAWNGAAKSVTDELAYAAPWYGARDRFVISLTRECGFELPWMGGGAPAGTNYPAPLLAILRACGHAVVVSAGVSVTFTPVNSGEEGATIRVTEDTFLRKMIGSRGSLKWVWAEGKVPRMQVALMGMYNTPADEAIPAATLPTLVKPVGFTKSNTIVTVGALALKCSSVEIDGGRTNEYRNHAGVEEISPMDCRPTATLEFELPTAAVKNVYQELETTTTQLLSVAHGTVIGNICTSSAPRAQLVDLQDKKDHGQIFVTAKFELLPGLTGAAPYSHVLT
jgi:hypothetical protein